MLKLLKFYFWILSKFNDGDPSRKEVRWAIETYWHSNRTYGIMSEYGYYGYSLETIANIKNVTRERIRQIIWKGVRQAWNHAKDIEE